MRCTDCTAESLVGLAYETSEVCDGPVDGEYYKNGDFIVSFRGMCHAVIASRIMNNEYKPKELVLRPAVNAEIKVIDLTESEVIVEFPQKIA